MTCRSVAAAQHVFALGLQGEILIKSGDPVQTGLADADLSGNIGEDLSGKVMVMFLDLLQDRDRGDFTLRVVLQDLIHDLKIKLLFHGTSLKNFRYFNSITKWTTYK